MNSNAFPAGIPWAQWRFKLLFATGLAVCLGAAVISHQSFWIDEAGTAAVACKAGLAEWWHALLEDFGSSTQMPLYMFYLWVWAKLFGPDEWWMRASNIPWFALGLLAIPRRQWAFLLAVVLSPFVWSYLDEARPYTMQISAALLLLGTLWRLAELPSPPGTAAVEERTWAGGFCLGLFLLSGSSLLGMIWSAAALACAVVVVGWPGAWGIFRRHVMMFTITALSLLALASFYIWSVEQGVRASTGPTGVNNVLFIAYEMFGLTGLGPGRLDIRNEGVVSFLPFVVPLALFSLVTAAVLVAGGHQVLQRVRRRVWLGVAVVLGSASVLLLAAGVIKHFRVLGRHFTPLVPVLLVLIGAGLYSLWTKAGWRRWVAVLFLLSSLAAALSFRLAPRHAKDDYREAAIVARAAVVRGKQVWWSADGNSGHFYGVPLSERNTLATRGQVFLACYMTEQLLTNQPAPDLIIVSKPDHYDDQGIVHRYIEREHYRLARALPAFTFWTRDAAGAVFEAK